MNTNMNTNERDLRDIAYRVGTFREAGLEARWGKTRSGAPIILARQDQDVWYAVNDAVWKRCRERGVRRGFEEATMLGRFFSVTL